MALLEVKDLRVHFQTEDGLVQALDGITYSVDAGQVLGHRRRVRLGQVGLVADHHGPHPRAERAASPGEVLFDGKNLLSASDSEMRELRGNDIAMIFQDPLSSLHPFYRIGDQLVEAVRAHRDVKKAKALDRAIEMLGLVGIPEPRRRVDSYPHEFSGGMRQRVMIAMALINDPKLLIADEPTTALDVTVQAQILELIDRLRTELDTAIVMITHDLGVVAEVTDDIAVMYAGRIVEYADKESVFAAPEHPYTWGLLKSIPRLDSAARRAARPDPGPPAVADPQARRLRVPPALPVRAGGPQAHRPAARPDGRGRQRRPPPGRVPAAAADAPRRCGPS